MTGWGPRTQYPDSGGGGGGNPDLPDSVLTVYGEVSAVVSGPETNILTYVTVGSTPTHIVRVEFGGTNIGRYRLYVDNVIQAQFVTWFNGPMDGFWDFSARGMGVEYNPGQTFKVTVEHGRPFSGDFWARFTLIRVDA